MKTYRKKQSVHHNSLSSPNLPLRHALNLAVLALLYPAFSYANPDGAQIINGQVSIDSATSGITTITNSPNAIINWQNFSIGQNELTQFIQQNGQSAVLNRIIGQNPSEILGQLTSNGKVFLINPNGIVFGSGSVIDTQGLIASSLNLSDQDFLSGNYHFIAGSSTGNIINEGIIRAGKDGNIILIAPQIENNGIIQSDGGSITLAAGHDITITNLDNPDIRFEIQAPTDSVVNLGKLLTEGGAVNVFANTITHSGEINANSVQIDKQGRIQLVAQQDITLTAGSIISANNSQGDAGTIHIDSKTGTTLAYGTIEAKASQTGSSTQLATGKGGNIELLGEHVGVLDQAKIDASGENGGGQILIGGDYQGKNPDIHNAKATYVGADTTIKADAVSNGDGGKVIVWADDSTRAYGDISAKGGSSSGNGGFIETSGHWLDIAGIRINASALNGIGGEWLLDPYNITITATGPTTTDSSLPFWTAGATNSLILNTNINTQLNNGTSITISTGIAGDSLGNESGDITVNAAITRSTEISTPGATAATFTLNAANNIIINNTISNTNTTAGGKLDVVLLAGNKIDLTNSSASINLAPTGGTSGGVKLQAGTGGIDNNKNNNTILADKLEVISIGDVVLGGTNKINTLAVSVTGSGKNFSFDNGSSPLTIDQVAIDAQASTTTGVTATGEIDISSGELTIPARSGDIISGQGITLTADRMITNGTAINPGTGTLWLKPKTAGWLIDLGSTANNTATTLELSTTELDALKGSDTLRIGALTAGNLKLSSPLAPAAFTGILSLESGGTVTQSTSADIITASKLVIKSKGNVVLDTATNVVNTLAASISGTGTEYFHFKNSGALSIDTIDNVVGISISNFPNYTSGSANGVIALESNGNITQTATGSLGGAAVWAKSTGGSVNLSTAANPTGIIAGSTLGDFSYKSSNTIALMDVDGHSGIESTEGGNFIIDAPGFSSNVTTPFTIPGSGRWLIYADSPAKVSKGGLTSSFRHYSATFANYASPTETGNGFIYASAPGTLTVNPSLTSGAASNTYGTAPTAVFGYSFGNSSIADNEDLNLITGTASFTPTFSKTTSVNNYTVNYLNGLSSAIGYTFTAGAGLSYKVNPALLNVSAIANSKTYGALDPTLTYTATGFVNNETTAVLTGALTRAAGETVAGGPYAIGQGSLANSNYTINFTSADFTIGLLSLNITADNTSRVYGDANPVFTSRVTAGELANNDTLDSIGLTYTTIATPTSNVGIYAITPKITNSNYTFTGIDGQLDITPLANTAWIGGNGNWSTASNWANSILPTSGNVLAASIPVGATVTYDSVAGNTNLNSLNSQGHFQMTGGNLGVSGNFTTAQYTQSGGNLSAGNFTSNDALFQTGGTINATNLTATSSGDITLAGTNILTGVMSLTAGGNIYSRTQGVSQVNLLSAPNGWIDVENIGGFILGPSTISPGTTAANAAGDIVIKAKSPLTVNGSVTSTGGRVNLVASNGDTLSINAPISSLNGITLDGGKIAGTQASVYLRSYEKIASSITTSLDEITAVVVGTTTQSGSPLTDNRNDNFFDEKNKNTDESTDTTTEKNNNAKQCVK